MDSYWELKPRTPSLVSMRFVTRLASFSHMPPGHDLLPPSGVDEDEDEDGGAGVGDCVGDDGD
eukprot:2807534-Pyramimonas_sp.AAC.1